MEKITEVDEDRLKTRDADDAPKSPKQHSTLSHINSSPVSPRKKDGRHSPLRGSTSRSPTLRPHDKDRKKAAEIAIDEGWPVDLPPRPPPGAVGRFASRQLATVEKELQSNLDVSPHSDEASLEAVKVEPRETLHRIDSKTSTSSVTRSVEGGMSRESSMKSFENGGSFRSASGGFFNGSFKGSFKAIEGISAYDGYRGTLPVAAEDVRSVRSRDDDSVRSGNSRMSHGLAPRKGVDRMNSGMTKGGTSQSPSRSVTGSNTYTSGGVFRARQRKKRMKKRNIPHVNMVEWNTHSKVLSNCWKILMKKSNYTDLGQAVYSKICEYDSLEPLFRFTDKSVQGTKFVDMLSGIVENAASPHEIDKKIADLAPMHHRRGVKVEHMPLMQEVLVHVMRTIMSDQFTSDHSKAWEYIWEFMTKSMQNSLSEVGSTLGVIRTSWDAIQERCAAEEVGEKIYDYLFQVVPHVQTIFSKPRQVMAVKMGRALELLVSFADEPKSMKQQLHWLGLRHVQYGVRPHHIPLMGPALMNTFADAAAEAWTTEFEKAWGVVWEMVCGSMSEAIQEGEDFGFSSQHLVSLVTEKASYFQIGEILYAELQSTSPETLSALSSFKAASNRPPSTSTKGSKELQTAMGFILGSPENKRSKSIRSIKASEDSKSKSKKDVSRPTNMLRKGSLGHSEKRRSSMFSNGIPWNESYETAKGDHHSNTSSTMLADPVEALGITVWSLIRDVTEELWEPEKQLELIYIFSFRHFKKGLRAEHLKHLGSALELAVEGILGDEGEWGDHVADSWRWLWRNLSAMLAQELDNLECDYNGTLLELWKDVKENTEILDLGQRFWNHCNNEAPEMIHLFHRPLKMWGHVLHHIIDMLCKSAEDPEAFYAELFSLTVKHIQWGVKADYLFPFGMAIMYTLEESMGDKWLDKHEVAWKEIWKRASVSMARGLNVGGSSVTHALVEGNASALRTAICYAPRNRRSEWLCQIEINGAVIKPLFWALKDGKFAIAEFILQELLTIRADLEGYYYSADMLFAHHEDIVGEILRECPPLMTSLLDGLLWHSREKLPGHQVRVNYYIRDLYGDPDIYRDAWKSPLARIVEHGDNDIFRHPAVRKTLDIKWSHFGLQIFCMKEGWYFLMLLIFMFSNVDDPTGCHEDREWLRMLLSAQTVATLSVLVYVAINQARCNKTKSIRFGSATVLLPRTLVSPWNVVRIIICVVILVAQAQHICDETVDCTLLNCTDDSSNSTIRRLLATKNAKDGDDEDSVESEGLTAFEIQQRAPWALVSVMMWSQLFQASVLSTPMAAFTYTIGMMFNDLSHSLIMMFVLLWGFGSSLYIMNEAPYDEGLDHTIIVLVQEVLGVSQPSISEVSPFTKTLLLTFLTCVVVVMLNVLIAQLTITYDKVNTDKEGFALRYRASVVLDVESAISMKWRRRIFFDLGFHTPLPFSRSEEGPSGGVQCLEPESCPRYVPDRILRFTGEASASDPWPIIVEEHSGHQVQ